MRLGMEGHQVKYYIKNKDEKNNLDGLIEKIDNWRQAAHWADYTIMDHTNMPEIGSFLSKAKIPTFGMGRKDGKIGSKQVQGFDVQNFLEKDRKAAKELMKSLKIGEESECLEFSDVSEALKHLKDHKVAHVIKPEMIGGDSSATYVGAKEDGSDSVGWLETLRYRPGGKVNKIAIEERIQGVEVATSGWFNGKEFIGRPNVNFEHKKLAAGNIGPNTGEMGTAMFYDQKESKLFKDTTAKMAETLAAFDFRGQCDINCIVNKDGIFPLEFTMRLGYPSIYIEQENHESPWGEFLGAIAKGEKYDLKVNDDWAIGAIMVGNGFPCFEEGYKLSNGLPIFGLNEKSIEHLHFYNVRYEDKRFLTNGCLPLIATAHGKTLQEAQDMLYKQVIPPVYFPDVFYRPDIGDRVHEDLKKLESYGYKFDRV